MPGKQPTPLSCINDIQGQEGEEDWRDIIFKECLFDCIVNYKTVFWKNTEMYPGPSQQQRWNTLWYITIFTKNPSIGFMGVLNVPLEY